MEGNWTVTYDGRAVGHCRVQKIGLYFHFSSCCKQVSQQLCRLYLRCEGIVVDLGIYIPENDCLVLEKRMAIKQLPNGQPVFFVDFARQTKLENEYFVPVCEDKPLPCLQKLRMARFAVRSGEKGILIKEEGCT